MKKRTVTRRIPRHQDSDTIAPNHHDGDRDIHAISPNHLELVTGSDDATSGGQGDPTGGGGGGP